MIRLVQMSSLNVSVVCRKLRANIRFWIMGKITQSNSKSWPEATNENACEINSYFLHTNSILFLSLDTSFDFKTPQIGRS